VIAEQDEIANKKGTDGALTWEDVSSMKYTWRDSASGIWELPNGYQGHRISGLSHPQRLESRHLFVHVFSPTRLFFIVRIINQEAFVSQHGRSSQPKALHI
jgi:hypothetical protein